jgi:hypothetical protein
MKERFILRIGFFLLAYLIVLSIFNTPSISFQEAAQIAEKVTPISDGYRISQIGGRNNWSFLFNTNPVYRLNVITIKTESGYLHRKFKFEIDSKTVLEIKEIN